MNDWKYVTSIEDMDAADIQSRIEQAMDYEIENRIVTIPYVGGLEELVEYRYPEMTAKCPMTGQRDFYELVIKFTPERLLPELKSLKLYLAGYDDLPISHEHLAAKVFRELQETIHPKDMFLQLLVGVRGGIKTTITIDQAGSDKVDK